MFFHKMADDLTDPVREKRGGTRYANAALRRRAHVLHDRLRCVGLNNHSQAVLVEFLTNFSDGKAPRRSLKKTHPKAVFQDGNPAAELRFLYANGPGGSGESAVFNDLCEKI
jgi:hypothetical protein